MTQWIIASVDILYCTTIFLVFPNLSLTSLIIFFFNDTATTEIYTLSLHDALPIYRYGDEIRPNQVWADCDPRDERSEEHTSELQSQSNLVCRLLLEKKKIHVLDAYTDYHIPSDYYVLCFHELLYRHTPITLVTLAL